MELNITLLIQLIIFLFILVWLAFVLLRPMIKLLEEREGRIEGTRKDVARLTSAGGEKNGIIEIRIEEARAQAQEERLALRAEGQKSHADLVEKARKQAMQKMQHAREEIDDARKKAAEQLDKESAKLAALIVSKVSGRKVEAGQ